MYLLMSLFIFFTCIFDFLELLKIAISGNKKATTILLLLYLFEYLKRNKSSSIETIVSIIVKSIDKYVLYSVSNNPKDQFS